jgi:hypothetical protein
MWRNPILMVKSSQRLPLPGNHAKTKKKLNHGDGEDDTDKDDNFSNTDLLTYELS